MSKTISIKDEDHAIIKNAQHILLNKYNMNVSVQNIISDMLPTYSDIADKIGKKIKAHGIFRYSYARPDEHLKDDAIYIYTAGKMPIEDENLANTWRGILENNLNRSYKIEWMHPTLLGCDHSGIAPEQTVQGDLEMIDRSDLVIAYLDQCDLYGTVSEIMYAVSIGKYLGLIFTKKNLSATHDYREGHRCSCSWEAIDYHCVAHEYWFLENLLDNRYSKQVLFSIDDIEWDDKDSKRIENGHCELIEPIIKYIDPKDVLDKLIDNFGDIYSHIQKGNQKKVLQDGN